MFTVALTGPELIAALVRRARGERQPTARVEATLASIRFDWQNLYILVEADDELVRRGWMWRSGMRSVAMMPFIWRRR